MLAECEAGNIDIVLTKSISRFARNTVDLLGIVRHLKELESTELFMSLVDKVIVGDGLTFIMRDGTEQKVNGVW